jgi:hypothetical protein
MTPVVAALLPYVIVQALSWLDRVVGPNSATDFANSWPGGFFEGVAFPVAIVYVLSRGARRGAATRGSALAEVA